MDSTKSAATAPLVPALNLSQPKAASERRHSYSRSASSGSHYGTSPSSESLSPSQRSSPKKVTVFSSRESSPARSSRRPRAYTKPTMIKIGDTSLLKQEAMQLAIKRVQQKKLMIAVSHILQESLSLNCGLTLDEKNNEISLLDSKPKMSNENVKIIAYLFARVLRTQSLGITHWFDENRIYPLIDLISLIESVCKVIIPMPLDETQREIIDLVNEAHSKRIEYLGQRHSKSKKQPTDSSLKFPQKYDEEIKKNEERFCLMLMLNFCSVKATNNEITHSKYFISPSLFLIIYPLLATTPRLFYIASKIMELPVEEISNGYRQKMRVLDFILKWSKSTLYQKERQNDAVAPAEKEAKPLIISEDSEKNLTNPPQQIIENQQDMIPAALTQENVATAFLSLKTSCESLKSEEVMRVFNEIEVYFYANTKISPCSIASPTVRNKFMTFVTSIVYHSPSQEDFNYYLATFVKDIKYIVAEEHLKATPQDLVIHCESKEIGDCHSGLMNFVKYIFSDLTKIMENDTYTCHVEPFSQLIHKEDKELYYNCTLLFIHLSYGLLENFDFLSSHAIFSAIPKYQLEIFENSKQEFKKEKWFKKNIFEDTKKKFLLLQDKLCWKNDHINSYQAAVECIKQNVFCIPHITYWGRVKKKIDQIPKKEMEGYEIKIDFEYYEKYSQIMLETDHFLQDLRYQVNSENHHFSTDIRQIILKYSI